MRAASSRNRHCRWRSSSDQKPAHVGFQGLAHLGGRERRQDLGELLRHLAEQQRPPAEGDQGLVQVEQDRAGQAGHAAV
jgi:hypothetical protein